MVFWLVNTGAVYLLLKSVAGHFSANCSITADLIFQQPKQVKEKERDINKKISNQPINDMDIRELTSKT